MAKVQAHTRRTGLFSRTTVRAHQRKALPVVAMNTVKELSLAVQHGRRCKELVLHIEVHKYGNPTVCYIVRSGFGQRMRQRYRGHDQVAAVMQYNSIT